MTNTIFIRDVMAKPVTIAKSAPVTEALDKMLDTGLDPLVVLHHDEVVGTVSRQKIVEKLGARHSSEVAPTTIHVSNTIDTEFTIVYEDQELDVLIPLLQNQAKLAVVYNEDNKMVGQVTYGDLLAKMIPDGDLPSVTDPHHVIEAGERMVHLRRKMVDEKIGRYVVMAENKMAGLVSETDVAVALTKFREAVDDRHQEHQIRNILVKDIMSSPAVSTDVNSSVSDVVSLMLSKNISSLPVTDNGKVVGIVTRQSLIRAL
ncbi:CBS domain-containing protein [Methanospirillum stamsii]|uniref:Signal transduction protein n=1 Tax=Methanospirillum stamsii TaxID=1277351 RepID=A0A2V2NDE6_9EURY|nr:CBS domain-containing protein [Methanospirillum stamsii]PWR75626.1 signal transduction protein [Methanospirillum stamsii]